MESAESTEEDKNRTATESSVQGSYNAWRSRRGAIIHSVDISKVYSEHAESIVRGFRRGLYAGSVDFYVARVEDWISSQIRLRKGYSNSAVDPFLSYAILDMPSANQQLATVAPVLRSDGIVAIFMPNISQIAECEKAACDLKLRLSLEKVVELGTGISGGRLWDVRYTKVRNKDNTRATVDEPVVEPNSDDDEASSEDNENQGKDSVHQELREKEEMVLVCRPKVGDRIVGGGFVGVWRKMKDSQN